MIIGRITVLEQSSDIVFSTLAGFSQPLFKKGMLLKVLKRIIKLYGSFLQPPHPLFFVVEINGKFRGFFCPAFFQNLLGLIFSIAFQRMS